MTYCFGDSWDLYAASTDMTAQYWDSMIGSSANFTLPAGRFTGSQCLHMAVLSSSIQKISTVTTDPVHHVVLAFRQTAALSGTALGLYFTLFDGATAQCSVVFRSDGAILLTS